MNNRHLVGLGFGQWVTVLYYPNKVKVLNLLRYLFSVWPESYLKLLNPKYPSNPNFMSFKELFETKTDDEIYELCDSLVSIVESKNLNFDSVPIEYKKVIEKRSYMFIHIGDREIYMKYGYPSVFSDDSLEEAYNGYSKNSFLKFFQKLKYSITSQIQNF